MTDYVIQANPSDFDARMQDKGGSKADPASYAPQGEEEKAKGVEMRRFNACAVPSLCKQPAEKQGKKTRKRGKRGKRLQRKRRNLTPLHMQDGGNDVCASAVDESPVLSSMIYISAAQQLVKFRWTVLRTRELTSSIFLRLVSSSALPTPSNALPSAFVAPSAGRRITVGACLASTRATPAPLPSSMTSAGMAMTASLAVSRSRSR
jgi:hypothetical protein